ncbi:MAG: hypothetical protein ACI8W8_000021 [Rhodothermales bacterium]
MRHPTLGLATLLAALTLSAAPKAQPRVNLDMRNVPLGVLIRYACTGARVSYKIENNAVIISGGKSKVNTVSTRFYKTSARFLSTLPSKGGAAAVQTHFEGLGIGFGKGAKVSYAPRRSLIVMTNTTAQFRKLERVLNELDRDGWRNSDADSIHKKLDEIVVSAVFENATISEVAAYLKKRSKALDPDGEGVNIFYVP